MLPMLSLGSPLAAAMMLTHISTHRSLVELVGPSWRPGPLGVCEVLDGVGHVSGDRRLGVARCASFAVFL